MKNYKKNTGQKSVVFHSSVMHGLLRKPRIGVTEYSKTTDWG